MKRPNKVLTKEDLIAQLDKLPPGTEIYVRSADDAYPAMMRVFEHLGGGGATAFFCVNMSLVYHHLNWPEQFSGVRELEV